MCHESPTASVLTGLVTIVGSAFIAWHIWSFDKGKCLKFTKRDAFRWVILMMLMIAIAGFFTWSIILIFVKYHEAYGVVPVSATDVEIMPVPFQLWTVSRQSLVRSAYHVLSVGWGFLLAVHAEETLYWGYLIGAIRSRTNRNWFHSVHFYLWILSATATLGVMPGVACIETTNLLKMENNIFLAGSVFATVIFLASLWLIYIFPGFINESRRQGANPEVLGRLHYFKELNLARSVFRLIYGGALLALSIDGYTKHAFLNTTPFWLDTLFVSAYFSAFVSTCTSLMILLPRSMTSEAGSDRTQAPVFIGRPNTGAFALAGKSGRRRIPDDAASYRRDRDVERQSTPWGVLGERLNLDKADLEDLAETNSSGEMFDLPFAAQPGSRMLKEGEEMKPEVPGQLKDFGGPLAFNQRSQPVDMNIVVTSTTVVDNE